MQTAPDPRLKHDLATLLDTLMEFGARLTALLVIEAAGVDVFTAVWLGEVGGSVQWFHAK
jgi:hypothetical protein